MASSDMLDTKRGGQGFEKFAFELASLVSGYPIRYSETGNPVGDYHGGDGVGRYVRNGPTGETVNASD